MGYERQHYQSLKYRPYLFYVAFGVSNDYLEVSRERHRVDGFPDGLDFTSFNKKEHGEYMDSLIGGTLGNVLASHNRQLYDDVQKTDKWAVIQGEVQNDSDLHYIRNTVGFVQALVEKGALGVLDLQTFSLYTPSEWTEKIFKPEFDSRSHVIIFTSKSEMVNDSIWLHTRGMRKFGRPDISIEKVSKADVGDACQVINQMIFYGAQGVFFSRPVKLHTHNGKTCIVKPELIDDLDNPDFNNAYYKILWDECKLEAK